jgi:hypothetical protein
MKNKVLAIILLLSSPIALAEWIGPYEIENIEVHSSGVYFFRAAGHVTNISCGDYKWVKFAGETKFSDRALSVGLTAQASGKKVNYFVTSCEGPYLIAERIQIPK